MSVSWTSLHVSNTKEWQECRYAPPRRILWRILYSRAEPLDCRRVCLMIISAIHNCSYVRTAVMVSHGNIWAIIMMQVLYKQTEDKLTGVRNSSKLEWSYVAY